jgi:tryptophanyl-tRNA synthetase
MSKSEMTSDAALIYMTDTADDIAQKIRKARTDADVLPETLDALKGRTEAENLVGIYAAEVAHTAVRVNLYNPGPMRTAMRKQAFPGEDHGAVGLCDLKY